MTPRLAFLVLACVLALPAPAADLAGRWVSPEYVTFTNPKLAGSAFHLDIVVAKDGSFQGSWDQYLCTSFPGAYGIATISCSRVKKPLKARGRIDAATGKGEIQLDQAGKGAFSWKLGKELVLELPKDWLKQPGDPVLYTSRLARPK